MSSDEDIYCSNCNRKTDQTLVLSCIHNLCLSCAAENLRRQQTKNMNNSPFIICDICNSFTELDAETANQIITFTNNSNNIFNNDLNYYNINKTPIKINENYFNENTGDNNYLFGLEEKISPKIKPTKHIFDHNNNCSQSVSDFNLVNDLVQFNDMNVRNNKQQICKEHGEPITYLCLDCMTSCICPECVVHGRHKNHEVLNIKKAYPLIYNKTQDLSKFVNSQIKDLYTAEQDINKKKEFIVLLIDKCKRDIKSTFDQLRLKLSNKEKEIIENTENILRNNIEQLSNFNEILRKKMNSLKKIVDNINIFLNKKDELNTINFFCENKDKILERSQINELDNMPDLDMYNNIRIESEQSSLNNLLNAIDDFHVNMCNYKNFNINKKNQNNYQEDNSDFYDDTELNNNDIPYENDNGRVDTKNNNIENSHGNSYRDRGVYKQRSKTPALTKNYKKNMNFNGFNNEVTNTYEIQNFDS